MINILQVFPISYDEEADGDFNPFEGLMDISPKATNFYNRLFGMKLGAGESPFGENESAFEEQVDAAAMGLPTLESPMRAPGIAFLVEDLDQAKEVLASEKVSIVNEAVTSTLRAVFVADPDENSIVIFQMLN